MRRLLILTAIGLLVFGGAAALGFLVSARAVPEHLRSRFQTDLTELLGAPVTIEQTQIYLRWGLTVEAREIASWPGPQGPGLQIRRALLRIDLLPLLAGRVEPRWLLFEEPTLRIERDAVGTVVAPFHWPPAADPEAPPRDAYDAAREIVGGALASLLGVPLPAPRVEIVGGRVVVRQSGGPEADPPALMLEGLKIRAVREQDLGTGEIELRTTLAPAEGPVARLRLTARRDGAGEVTGRLAMKRLVLQPLAPYLRRLDGELAFTGEVTGDLDLRMSAGQPHRLDLNLRLRQPSLVLPGAERPLAARSAHLQAALVLAQGRLELWAGSLRTGGVKTRLDGALELPLDPSAGTRLVLRVPTLDLEGLEPALDWLGEEAREAAREGLARLESGRLEDLELRVAAPLSSYGGGLGEAAARLLRDLELRGRLEDGRVRLGETDRLEHFQAQFVVERDRLELKVADALLNEVSLPDLDVSLHGLTHLLPSDELHCLTPPSAGPWVGRAALLDWIEARRDPEGPRTWSRLHLEADWLDHPLLLCRMEHLQATVAPAEDGWVYEVKQATWAGAPLKARGVVRARPEESLSVVLEVGPPWEPVSPLDPSAPWASGRFEVAANAFGPWRVHGARGDFSAWGSEVRLEGVRLDLEPEGELRADLTLDLGQADLVPYRTAFTVENGSLAQMMAALERDRRLASGTLVAAGVLSGVLRDAESPFAEARGSAVLLARDGVLHRRIPPILAISMAGEAMAPFRDREEIPYTAVDGVFELENGILRSRSLAIDGPVVRVLASGEMNVVDPPYPTRSVVAVFLFRGVDNVISKVPVLSRVILGEDENLINAYFALSGPAGQPEARLIPVKTLAAGPASFVLEGFPAFVRGGLRRLLSFVAPDRGTREIPVLDGERADL